jgi:hypothetical protein
MVGDYPGGEYVLHRETVENLGKRGSGEGGNIVNVNVTVEGDVHGDTVVEYITKEVEKRVGYLMNCGV